jgi:hypothetical protein
MGISGGPDMIQDGLVLALDAADRNSYPGSGTTWRDLSGNNNSGSLTNGPTFDSANGGSIVFDGTNDLVRCTNNTSVQITVGTIGAWINANSNNTGFRGIITKQSAWGLFLFDNVLVTYDWGVDETRSTGINIGNNTWNYVAMSFTQTIGTPSDNAIIYINRNAVLTTTVQHSLQTVEVQIGDGGNSNQYLNGNVSIAHIYNRVLSATEILQNYNAQKSRFNL